MDEESHLGEKLIETIMSMLKRRTNNSGEQRGESIQRAAGRGGVLKKAGEKACLLSAVRKEMARAGRVSGRMTEWGASLEGCQGGEGPWEDDGVGRDGGQVLGRVLGWRRPSGG